MKRAVVIGMSATVVFAAIVSVEARVRFPWEPPLYHARIIHKKIIVVPIDDVDAPPPNCEQINDAIKTLDPKNYEAAMRSSNRKQKQTIAKCQEKVKKP